MGRDHKFFLKIYIFLVKAQNFFFLEYVGELRIFVLRRRGDPNTITHTPLWIKVRSGRFIMLELLQINWKVGPDQGQFYH